MIDLCRASLGWKEGDPNEDFFAWKHDENPFGASPVWLAVAPDGSLAGLRALMRWRFSTPTGPISAVRAVDTATHPDWQGKGIFKRLTLGALNELEADGLDVVFNTPNDQSRPGYLKMGWSQVGRVPVSVRVRSPLALGNLTGARAAAEMWSETVDTGIPAATLLRDTDGVAELLQASAMGSRGNTSLIATDRSPEYLRWRYSLAPLHYRALALGSSLADGMVVFRVRRRGTATELTVCDVLAPRGAPLGAAVGYL
ncbi:MAG: GNAT family N-acetyltransferase, partial [Microthrixaceae bacterium]|nr:GNAT family N-acetyltransferase [Microthrixaceae bacterium]